MLFEISYLPGELGCPPVFNGDLSAQWDWEPYDPNLTTGSTEHAYVYRTYYDFIDFDYFDEWLVSDRFAKLAAAFGLTEITIPVALRLIDGSRTNKSYCFLRTSEYVSILDEESSVYSYERSLETGEVIHDKYFPKIPHYESISRFLVDPMKVKGRHIFRCIDVLHHYVCSEDFKAACEHEGLKGLKFTPIDDTFKVEAYW